MSFKTIIERLLSESQRQLTLEQPSLDVTFKNFRFSLVGEPLTQNSTHFCLRRHPENPWTFSKLIEHKWCTDAELEIIIQLLNSKSSLLIIGPTGSGKTSVINALLNQVPENERCLLIEDNSEICIPNPVSLKLLTREDPFGILPAITQNDLIKKSLRLRPDRLIMGEIRGIEAKDFLLALSTGHSGSLATLHAKDPHEALLRLEMLIQMGAPQWSLSSIRRLIYLSLHHILVVDKNINGKRFLKGIYKINSLEDLGFLLEKLDPEIDHLYHPRP